MGKKFFVPLLFFIVTLAIVSMGCYGESIIPDTPIQYDIVDEHVFSSCGQYYAHRAKFDGQWTIIINNVPGYFFDYVDQPHFSPDNKCFAYRAKKDSKWFMVINGIVEGPYDFVEQPHFAPNTDYSDDHVCLIFKARIDGNWGYISIHESHHNDNLLNHYLEEVPDKPIIPQKVINTIEAS